MSFSFTGVSFTVAWLAALTVALGVATGTASIVAWFTLALVGLMPLLMLMVLAHTPTKTMSEIIYDLETGRPL